jgi:hypothetical protein
MTMSDNSLTGISWSAMAVGNSEYQRHFQGTGDLVNVPVSIARLVLATASSLP